MGTVQKLTRLEQEQGNDLILPGNMVCLLNYSSWQNMGLCAKQDWRLHWEVFNTETVLPGTEWHTLCTPSVPGLGKGQP